MKTSIHNSLNQKGCQFIIFMSYCCRIYQSIRLNNLQLELERISESFSKWGLFFWQSNSLCKNILEASELIPICKYVFFISCSCSKNSNWSTKKPFHNIPKNCFSTTGIRGPAKPAAHLHTQAHTWLSSAKTMRR